MHDDAEFTSRTLVHPRMTLAPPHRQYDAVMPVPEMMQKIGDLRGYRRRMTTVVPLALACCALLLALFTSSSRLVTTVRTAVEAVAMTASGGPHMPDTDQVQSFPMTASSDGVRAGGDSGSDSRSAVEGDDGADDVDGDDVPTGLDGDDGDDGADGVGGEDGDDDADDADGDDVPTGSGGHDDDDGADGVDGETGDDNAYDADSDDVPTESGGDDGDDGADGVDGAYGDDFNLLNDDAHVEVQPLNAWAPYELNIDLRSFEVVDAFLKSKGISDGSTEEEILQWVPSAIVIRMWPSRVQQAIGIDAEGGHVAFNIANAAQESGVYMSSFLIVMDLRGENINVTVVSDMTNSTPDAQYGVTHFDGLKLLDPDTLLLSGNSNPDLEAGPPMTFAMKTGSFSMMSQGTQVSGTAHDIQWQPLKNGSAGVYRTVGAGFGLFSTSDGSQIESYNAESCYFNDVNHAQVLHEEGYAIVSSRMTSSFSKFDMASNQIMWTCGGHQGNFLLVDQAGDEHPAGSSWLFHGQHNVEHFGDNEYMLFDNNFNYSTATFIGDSNSRLVILNINEDTMTATEVWTLELDEQTCIYGDNDRLPSGNLLGSSWPIVIDASSEFQYDARIFEIERGTKDTAWEAFVIGQRCTSPEDGSFGCVRSAFGGYPSGWSMYSVERFYDTPLVWNISCTLASGSDGDYTLNFNTHNNFKMNGFHDGTFQIYSEGTNGVHGDAVVDETFLFEPHWRSTYLSASIEQGSTVGMLSVTNQWGRRTMKHYSCV